MPTSGGSISQIDELVVKLNGLADPAARAVTVELLRAVMNLHAEAFERVLEIVAASAPEIIAELGADELVSRVLALHGIHPHDFEVRFARAIDKLERFFDPRGAGIQVIEASPELIRIRFNGSRPGSGPTARKAIEDAIYEAVPEIGELIVEGIDVQQATGFVPLASLLTAQQV